MPGRYGNDRQTTRNLEVVDIRSDDNIIFETTAGISSKVTDRRR